MAAHHFGVALIDAPPAALPYVGDDGAVTSIDTAGATTGQPVVYDANARGTGKPGFALGAGLPPVPGDWFEKQDVYVLGIIDGAAAWRELDTGSLVSVGDFSMDFSEDFS